ncbi:unnamed protein product, partial [Ectocarpus fasciculatus]
GGRPAAVREQPPRSRISALVLKACDGHLQRLPHGPDRPGAIDVQAHGRQNGPFQVCPGASGGRVLRRRRRSRRPPARQLRRGEGQHAGLPRVEAGHDGGAGHAAPGADDRRSRGRGPDADCAPAAVLGALLPGRVRRVLLEAIPPKVGAGGGRNILGCVRGDIPADLSADQREGHTA